MGDLRRCKECHEEYFESDTDEDKDGLCNKCREEEKEHHALVLS